MHADVGVCSRSLACCTAVNLSSNKSTRGFFSDVGENIARSLIRKKILDTYRKIPCIIVSTGVPRCKNAHNYEILINFKVIIIELGHFAEFASF